jgi:hypothetical protein
VEWDSVYAGDGDDTVVVSVDGNGATHSKRDHINCGDGDDTIVLIDGFVDPRDHFVNCETIND